jgi:hypothetical protein
MAKLGVNDLIEIEVSDDGDTFEPPIVVPSGIDFLAEE